METEIISNGKVFRVSVSFVVNNEGEAIRVVLMAIPARDLRKEQKVYRWDMTIKEFYRWIKENAQ